MGLREDLAYEKRETETPYIFTGASDIDEALEIAWCAVRDAKSFREYAKGSGIDKVKTVEATKWGVSYGTAAACFVAGAACCLLVIWCLGVI